MASTQMETSNFLVGHSSLLFGPFTYSI